MEDFGGFCTTVQLYKLMEKMEFWGLCTAVHTVWKIGGFFGGALGRAALI